MARYFLPAYLEITRRKTPACKGGFFHIRNRLNGAEVQIDDPYEIREFERILRRKYVIKETSLVKQLIEQDCLVDAAYNRRMAKELLKQEEKTLFITMMPTEGCNFRCPYCYENHPSGTMSKETFDRCKSFIERLIAEHEFNVFQLSWFGGEPTLCLDSVIGFTAWCRDVAQNHDIDFQTAMVTNGYFLTLDNLKRLLAVGVNNFQVTIDGFRHDKTRFLAGGQGTLKRILNNIAEIARSDTEGYEILIRRNLLPGDTDTSWYGFMKSIVGDNPHFVFGVIPVAHLGGPHDDEFEVLSSTDKLLDEHERAIRDAGLKLDDQSTEFYPAGGICYASHPYGFVIRENGDLNKCTIALRSDFNKVGSLETGIDVSRNNTWSRDALNPRCFNCPMCLVCMNRCCPLRRELCERKVYCYTHDTRYI